MLMTNVIEQAGDCEPAAMQDDIELMAEEWHKLITVQ